MKHNPYLFNRSETLKNSRGGFLKRREGLLTVGAREAILLQNLRDKIQKIKKDDMASRIPIQLINLQNKIRTKSRHLAIIDAFSALFAIIAAIFAFFEVFQPFLPFLGFFCFFGFDFVLGFFVCVFLFIFVE